MSLVQFFFWMGISGMGRMDHWVIQILLQMGARTGQRLDHNGLGTLGTSGGVGHGFGRNRFILTLCSGLQGSFSLVSNSLI